MCYILLQWWLHTGSQNYLSQPFVASYTLLLLCCCSFWTLTANPDALSSKPVKAAAAKRGCDPAQVGKR
jgi:hypothetical protein